MNFHRPIFVRIGLHTTNGHKRREDMRPAGDTSISDYIFLLIIFHAIFDRTDALLSLLLFIDSGGER